jgi:hypothetical protein
MRLVYLPDSLWANEFFINYGNWISSDSVKEFFNYDCWGTNLHFGDFIFFGSTCFYINFLEILVVYELLELSFVKFLSLQWELLFTEWIPTDVSWVTPAGWSGLVVLLKYSIHLYFLVFYFLYLFLKLMVENGSYLLKYFSAWGVFVDLYLLTWVVGGEDKVETTEEILVLFFLWPWCVFLIFTHTFGWSDHSTIFGFAEWGLPVIYGYILLLEHIWVFGAYMVVYLMGIRTRKSMVANCIEDIVALVIMVARVSLQMVRGVIVGMFHFICREAVLNMNRWWSTDIWCYSGSAMINDKRSWVIDMILVWVDFWVAAGSLIVVTAIMFLQLIFLIVSVWLFCKCWYTSWLPKFYRNNYKVQKNYRLNIATDASSTTST